MCVGKKCLDIINITITGSFYVSFSDQNSESQGPKHLARDHTATLHCYMGRATKVLSGPNPALWDILGSIRQGRSSPEIGSSLDSTGSLFSLGKPNSVLELVREFDHLWALVTRERNKTEKLCLWAQSHPQPPNVVLGCFAIPNLICFLPSCVVPCPHPNRPLWTLPAELGASLLGICRALLGWRRYLW